MKTQIQVKGVGGMSEMCGVRNLSQVLLCVYEVCIMCVSWMKCVSMSFCEVFYVLIRWVL